MSKQETSLAEASATGVARSKAGASVQRTSSPTAGIATVYT